MRCNAMRILLGAVGRRYRVRLETSAISSRVH